MRQTEATITESFKAILDSVENNVMRNLRVGTLARVLSVDNKLLSVEPIIKEKINTQSGYKYLRLPIIDSVYCISGQAPKVGDYVICIHFDRGLSGFNLFNDKTGYIESGTHRHDIGDCVAIVINTDETPIEKEWKKVGEYSSVTQIDLSSYSEIRVVLKSNNIQLSSQIYLFDDGETVNAFSQYNDTVYNVTISRQGGITFKSTGDFTVTIYGR